MDNTQNFSGLANDYAIGRPTYSKDNVLTIANKTVAYIGRMD